MFDEVIAFMKEASPIYIATVEENAPRVRPMGFVSGYDGKVTFASSAGNGTTKQLEANSNIEVSCTAATRDKALRIKGKAIIVSDIETIEAMMEAEPNLKRISPTPDGITIFYIDNPEATFWTYTGVTAVDL